MSHRDCGMCASLAALEASQRRVYEDTLKSLEDGSELTPARREALQILAGNTLRRLGATRQEFNDHRHSHEVKTSARPSGNA